jgi:hypothetical protein
MENRETRPEFLAKTGERLMVAVRQRKIASKAPPHRRDLETVEGAGKRMKMERMVERIGMRQSLKYRQEEVRGVLDPEGMVKIPEWIWTGAYCHSVKD